jgi:hypothetical protein
MDKDTSNEAWILLAQKSTEYLSTHIKVSLPVNSKLFFQDG